MLSRKVAYLVMLMAVAVAIPVAVSGPAAYLPVMVADGPAPPAPPIPLASLAAA